MSRHVRSAAIALLLATPAASAHAQGAADWPEQSVRGLAAVDLSGDVSRQGDSPSSWSVGTGYAPFVTEHWQVGLGIGSSGGDAGGGRYTTRSAAAWSNYWIGGNRRSRPYVGAVVGVSGGSGAVLGNTWWGGRVGWGHFVTPFTALHASLTAERDSWGPPDTYTTLGISLQPYAFGRTRASRGFRAGQPGAFDLSLGARAELTPQRSYSLRAGVAPFLFRALQVGGTVDALYWPPGEVRPEDAAERHTLEGFVRAYYPTRGTLQPFAGAFLSRSRSSGSPGSAGSHGGTAGVRAYPNSGVALDLFFELRQFTRHGVAEDLPDLPDRAQLRASVTTHIPRRARP
jgi:hypothetical protein